MFESFFDALASVLNFFYALLPEGAFREHFGFGFAIMGLTVLVMTIITPLTVKSTRSMIQMQRLQPEMKRLQEKYKDDREKLNQELMAFYREHQINPLGGCLPLLAQMPVFIIMYQLLRGLTVRQGGLGTGAGRVIAQSAGGASPTEIVPWVFTEQSFRPDHLDSGEMYQALTSTSEMNFLGMDLSLSASEAISRGLLTALPYLLLLLVILATGLYQNRQMQARNTSGNVNPQQQMIMRFMPFFLPIFSFGFPAGLALYWSTQNLCRIVTNAYITRNLYKKEHEGEQVIETTAKEKVSSKGTAQKKVGSGGSKKASPAKATGGGSSGPGKSVKSQKVHQKKSGQGGSTASSKNGTRTSGGRRSGEPRRGPSEQKRK